MIQSFTIALRKNKKYISSAVSLFFVGIIIGYLFLDQNHPIIQAMLEQVQSIVQKVKEKDSVAYMIQTIFLNNLFVAILMIISGAFLGIYPIINLMVQGLMIGFLAKFLFEQGKSISFVLIGILPHGILEIPAILIASAFGMKLGFSIIKVLLSFIRQVNKENRLVEFRDTIKQIPIVILGLTIILFFAAIIESTLTVYLLQSIYQ